MRVSIILVLLLGIGCGAGLHDAVRQGDKSRVQTLLSGKVKINEPQGEDKDSPLHIAAANGDLDLVKLLVEKKANVTQSDRYGMTPLIVAAVNGHTAILQYLLQHGAKIDHKDQFGRDALAWCAISGREKALRTLLVHTPAPAVDVADHEGRTPLLHAAAGNHPNIITILLEKGADPKHKDKQGKTALDLAREKDYFPAIRALEKGKAG